MNSALAEISEGHYSSLHQLNTVPKQKVLSVNHLRKSYNAHQTVLHDISFDLHRGEDGRRDWSLGRGEINPVARSERHAQCDVRVRSTASRKWGRRAMFHASKAARLISGAANAG